MEIALATKPERIDLRAVLAQPKIVHIVLSVLFFSVLIGFYLFDPFGFEAPGRDTWHHAAVLRELMASPFHPSNPHIPTDEPSRYFSPLNLLAALVGRTFGWSPWSLFGYLGAVTCIAFPVACWQFARRYFGSPWAPPVFMTILLFGWGAQESHTGFYNLASLFSSAAYPANQALVLGIFSWALCTLALKDARTVWRIALAHIALTAILVLTHQFSAVIMLAGTVSLIAFRRDTNVRTKVELIAGVAIGGLLSLLWPYFNVIEVVFSGADPRWASPNPEMSKPAFLLLMGAPSLFGILAFKARDTGKMRWEIVVPTVFFLICYCVLTIKGAAIAHRFTPAIILYLQLGMTWALLAAWPKISSAGRLRTTVPIAVILFLAISMLAASSARIQEFRVRANYGRMLPSVKDMAAFVPAGAISFASTDAVYPFQSTGRHVVSIPRPEPVAPSLPARQAATDRFFARTTSSDERRALLRQWHASYIVFAPENLTPDTIAALRRFGPSRKFVRDIEIVAVEPAEARQ